jgi:transcription elongation factor Elf1
MSNVVDLAARRKPVEPEAPYLRGDAFCLACGHEWLAVAPIGTDTSKLECSVCHASRGVFKHHVVYANTQSWTCAACQGFLFALFLHPTTNTPSLACAGCGSVTDAIHAFPQ